MVTPGSVLPPPFQSREKMVLRLGPNSMDDNPATISAISFESKTLT